MSNARRGAQSGDPVLHRLMLGELAAESLPLERPLAEHVERPPRLAQPAHAVVDAARSEPDLGDLEALAAPPDQVLARDADVLVEDLGMPIYGALGRAGHGRYVAEQVDSRRVGG